MNIFVRVLRLLEIKHTREYARKIYEEHPGKYNFLGLSEIFSAYNIKTACYKFHDTRVEELPLPFIALLNGSFCIVEQITGSGKLKIYYRDEHKKIEKEHFYSGWDGYAMCITEIENAAEPDYSKHVRRQWLNDLLTIAAVFSAIFIIFSCAVRFFTPLQAFLLLLNAGGIYFSYLTLQSEKNSVAKKLCSKMSRSDCGSVLSSSASKLFGVYSLGELGTTYFLSNILILAFDGNLVHILFYINLLAVLFSVWSIAYQKWVAKSWCLICLLTQGIVLSTIIVYIITGNFRFDVFLPSAMIRIIAVFILVFYGVHYVYQAVKVKNSLGKKQSELAALKFNREVLRYLLEKQQYYNTRNASAIIFNPKRASQELTIVLNPYCGPCERAHRKLDSLYKEGALDCWNVKFLFMAFTPEKEKIIEAFIGFYFHHTPRETLELISNWYKKKDERKMLEYHRDYKEEPLVRQEVERQNKWLSQNHITATPTILLNGYRLPQEYDLTDLAYFKSSTGVLFENNKGNP